MSISSCCDTCGATVSTATSNYPGGWDVNTFASTASQDKGNYWEMPATPDYNQLTWVGTAFACEADWKDCSNAGQQFAGFQDTYYDTSNNGVIQSSGCDTCTSGKHVLCSSNQINTCPGVDVFGDGGLGTDASKVVYAKTTDDSFSNFKRGLTWCQYPKNVVQTPLQMRTLTNLISKALIDPVVGDALATTYCSQVVVTPTTGPVCTRMLPLDASNAPPGLAVAANLSDRWSQVYTGFVAQYVPAPATGDPAAPPPNRRVLWVFELKPDSQLDVLKSTTLMWPSFTITAPAGTANEYNDRPSYGVMVWASSTPNMAAFRLLGSYQQGSSVPKSLVSKPNDNTTTFDGVTWTQPVVTFYAPPTPTAVLCNTIEFAVSTSVMGDPGSSPGNINFMKIWGKSVAEQPPLQESCVTSPVTGKPMVQCSRFRAAGEGGDACRSWATSRKVPGKSSAADEAYLAYCNANGANADCDCIKRNEAIGSTDQVVREHYQAIAGSEFPVPDTCWFIPCKDNDGNYALVTRDILEPPCGAPPCKTCPDNVCIEVVQAWAKRDADIKNIDMNMDCKSQYNDYVDNKYACDNCNAAQPAPSDASPVKKGFASVSACKSSCGGGSGDGLSAGAIAGIVLACIVLFIVVPLCAVYVPRRAPTK